MYKQALGRLALYVPAMRGVMVVALYKRNARMCTRYIDLGRRWLQQDGSGAIPPCGEVPAGILLAPFENGISNSLVE